jgi:hypothetical protein
MIDLLRMIDPLPMKDDEEQKQKNQSISSSSQQRKYHRPSNHYNQHHSQEQRNESMDVEDVFVDEEISTIIPPGNRRKI